VKKEMNGKKTNSRYKKGTRCKLAPMGGIRCIVSLFLLILSYNCYAQTTTEDMKTKDCDARDKRRADKIMIESPIIALLEIKKEEKGVIAVLSLFNPTDKGILIDKNKLGGDKLRNHIFHLNPWYTSPVLSFKPYSSFLEGDSVEEEYIVIKPNETIKTETNLSEYYDFNERTYEIIDFVYVAVMKHLDENHQQIYQRDIDDLNKPVEIAIFSNRVKLEYKDVVP
jgi:hypothetical protein